MNNIISITYGIDTEDEKLNVTTYEKDELIFKVVLNIDTNTIEINYSNMDKVNNFIKDFKVKE